MQYGVIFPTIEIGHDPGAIRAYVQAAEGLGFDYLITYDHVLGVNPDRPDWRGPYTNAHPFHEPMVLFGYLAAFTARLELTAGVLVLPQRQTALVAKQAAQVDLLSGGRLCLGVGVGWNAVEYEGLGQSFATRGRRIEAQIALLRALWTQPLVTGQVGDETVVDAGINPLPPQRPIPIWFGGAADPVLERMARLGDGWLAPGLDQERATRAVATLRSHLARQGRNPADFGIRIALSHKDNPDAWAERLGWWRELGATGCAINTMYGGLSDVDQHIATIERFWDARPR